VSYFSPSICPLIHFHLTNRRISNSGDTYSEQYDGINVPEEVKVFALPKKGSADQVMVQKRVCPVARRPLPQQKCQIMPI
jgi:hypothetical protein